VFGAQMQRQVDDQFVTMRAGSSTLLARLERHVGVVAVVMGHQVRSATFIVIKYDNNRKLPVCKKPL
jgi:hypothetical protein